MAGKASFRRHPVRWRRGCRPRYWRRRRRPCPEDAAASETPTGRLYIGIPSGGIFSVARGSNLSGEDKVMRSRLVMAVAAVLLLARTLGAEEAPESGKEAAVKLAQSS